MIFRFWVVLLAFSGLGLGAALAGEKVKVELYLAENGPPAPEAKLAPEKLHRRLIEVFGYKHYELVQADEIDMHHEWEQWFMPRKDFFMRVQPQPRVPGQPRVLDYEIYKDGFSIANGKFEPREGTPLFINGPFFHSGMLIFVLEPHAGDI
jgi:hypothetical protein